MPATLNISLPAKLRSLVDAEVARGAYGSASEYVRELLRDAFRRRAQEDLEDKLLQGLGTPATVMRRSDWDRLEARIRRSKARTRR